MSYPDFSSQGYQVIRELGRNREGGRITWLALKLATLQQVVVKQFCFAQFGSSWSAFTEHEREIQVLQGLNHPGIPKYLGAFETTDGFCLIQEYKNAPTLAIKRSFDPLEIRQITVKALEILVYLQNRLPPIIHRDIKPENILVDDQLNVYLIDFGMSRIGSEEVSGSSIFKGTPGFIPPEQVRQPTTASDLYGLGVTLICLLTGTASGQIHSLTDEDDPYVIHFRHLLPQISLPFLNWLKLMVKPRLKERFANAQTALEAFRELDILPFPVVELSQSVVEFTASRLEQKLRQTITVNNSIANTLLQGKWIVAPHPHDPPHIPDFHAWIQVEPARFGGNNCQFFVQVDTSKLLANQIYERQLFLHTNSHPNIHVLNVKLKTASIISIRQNLPYSKLTVIFSICVVFSALVSRAISIYGAETINKFMGVVILGIVFGALLGGSINENFSRIFARFFMLIALWYGGTFLISAFWLILDPSAYLILITAVAIFVFWAVHKNLLNAVIGAIAGVVIAVVSFAIGWPLIGGVSGAVVLAITQASSLLADAQNKFISIVLLLLSAGLGISVGIAYVLKFSHPYIFLALAFTGLPLTVLLVYLFFQQRLLIINYQQSKEHLIKP